MSQSAHLWLYFVIVFGVVALPGLDMAFVMGSSLVGGPRSGLCAVAGIMAGGLCHMAMGALGVAIVLRMWPALFNTMLLAGALYVGWIGWGLLRASPEAPSSLRNAPRRAAMTFLRALLTSLMNPKAYVFMLAVFPQFVHPAGGPVWVQAMALAAITATTQGAVYGTLALLAGRARGWAGANPGASVMAARAVGLVLLLSALLVATQGWRATH